MLGPHRPARGVHHPDGAPALDEHPGHRSVAVDPAAAGGEPGDERIAERAGPALRHGEADVLGEHGEEPAERGAAGAGGRDVGVHRVAGHEDPRALAVELLLPEAQHGEHEAADEAQQVGGARRAEQADGAAHRRERREQGAQQRLAQLLPLRGEAAPRVAVARGEPVDRRCGRIEVAGDDGAAVVGQDVRQRLRGVAPAQAVRVEAEPAQHRGRGAERVERAAEIGAPARGGELGAAGGAAGPVAGVEHEHPPAGVGEQVGRDEPVVPGADHDGVGALGVAGGIGHPGSVPGSAYPANDPRWTTGRAG